MNQLGKKMPEESSISRALGINLRAEGNLRWLERVHTLIIDETINNMQGM
jgi:hypothetical protein